MMQVPAILQGHERAGHRRYNFFLSPCDGVGRRITDRYRAAGLDDTASEGDQLSLCRGKEVDLEFNGQDG